MRCNIISRKMTELTRLLGEIKLGRKVKRNEKMKINERKNLGGQRK